MRINSVMVSERVGEDWLVLDPGTSQVHQLSGLNAEVFSAVIAGNEVPVGCEDVVAALLTANILMVDGPPNSLSLLNDTATAEAPGMSRRRLIGTGALAAGAVTLAASAGIHTLVLPTAAAAASLPAQPVVYAATLGGLGISTDGGTSFTNRTTTQGLGNNAVYEVFVSGSTVYAATFSGLGISTDGGASFTNRTTDDGLGNNTVFAVFVSGSTVYAATEGGLSISTDGGTSFTNRTTTDGLGNNSVRGVFAVPGVG